jgi:four helix bundle protein
MKPYERLAAWKASHELVLTVYRVTDGFPDHERFGLTARIRRAAVSVPANIAEGVAKRGARELRRFLDISLGSLSELTYLLRLSHDLGMLTDRKAQELSDLHQRAGAMLWKLYSSMG